MCWPVSPLTSPVSKTLLTHFCGPILLDHVISHHFNPFTTSVPSVPPSDHCPPFFQPILSRAPTPNNHPLHHLQLIDPTSCGLSLPLPPCHHFGLSPSLPSSLLSLHCLHLERTMVANPPLHPPSALLHTAELGWKRPGIQPTGLTDSAGPSTSRGHGAA